MNVNLNIGALQDAVHIAMRKAFHLGQVWWQQADSENVSQHKKADATQTNFDELVDSIRNDVGSYAAPIVATGDLSTTVPSEWIMTVDALPTPYEEVRIRTEGVERIARLAANKENFQLATFLSSTKGQYTVKVEKVECWMRIAAPSPTEQASARNSDLLNWAVDKWYGEVSNRPVINVHRRSLDDTWRQIIRKLGGDDVLLCGLRHDDLIRAESATPSDKGNAPAEAKS